MSTRDGRFRWAVLLAAVLVVAVVASGTPGEAPPAAAEPEQVTYALTLTQPASGGMLDHFPKRDAYAQYERVVIRARIHGGYRLTGWSGDCAHVSASTPWCILMMDADKAVSATFGPTGATPTPTATPTATPTITVKATYTLALATATNGALTASPDETSYEEGATVVVTATPKAGYRLTAWGDDCASIPATSATCTLTMNADRTVSATFGAVAASGPLSLIVVSDGSTNSLLLEWTGGPASASKWQYRRTTWNQKKSVPNPWGNWTDIPGSNASTRSYRLSGLSSDTGHRFEVRAVVGTTAGAASNRGHGITHVSGEYPQINPDKIVEGDGRTEWRVADLGFVITIPDGVRLEGGWGATPAGGQPSIDVWVVEPYLAGILFSYDGHVLNRHVVVPQGPDSAATDTSAADALLDKIISSLRRPD